MFLGKPLADFQLDIERQRAETAMRRADRLAEVLREQGIDLDAIVA